MATFTLDPMHSQVEFTVRHMMFSKVRGAFSTFSGQLQIDEATNMPTSIDATIDVSSIDTKVGDRDAHLRSADFFDSEQYGSMTFKSTSIQGTPDAFKIAGDLTMHGVTKSVTLDGTFEGRGKDPFGNDRVAYSAKTRLNRKDFGLNWNAALETGGVLVGEDIDIELTIQAIPAKEPASV